MLCQFHNITFNPLPTSIILPNRSRAVVLRPHCNDCIADSYTTASYEARSNISIVYRYNRKGNAGIYPPV
jgi:hypothetical protein